MGKRPSNDPNSEAFVSRGPRNNAWGTPNWNRKFAERAPTPLIQDETVNSDGVTVDENEDYAEPAPKLSDSDGLVNSTVASPTEDPKIAVTARTFINSDGVAEYEAATIYENANFAVPSSTPSDPYGPDNLETATPTLMSVITPPPASYGTCTPTQCTLTASVRSENLPHNSEAYLIQQSPCPSIIGPQYHRIRTALLHWQVAQGLLYLRTFHLRTFHRMLAPILHYMSTRMS